MEIAAHIIREDIKARERLARLQPKNIEHQMFMRGMKTALALISDLPEEQLLEVMKRNLSTNK